jgi:hypothetical protein
MLEVLRIVSFGTAIGVMLVAIASALPLSFGSRLVFGGAVGTWIGFVIAVQTRGDLSPLATLALFALPLLTVALLATLPSARAAVLAIPVPLIIGLNAFRVLGIFMLLLITEGRLAGPFPYFAGIGDIITGVFALPVAAIAARYSVNNPRVIAWNAFGALDLIVALTLGITSRPGSPIQLIHAGVGSAAITTLPMSMIPLVLVPAFLIGHVIVFARMRTQSAPSRSVQMPA